MDGFIVFVSKGEHWLGKFLHPKRKHVFCVIPSMEHWIAYDWKGGDPQMVVYGTDGEEIETWLKQHASDVLRVRIDQRPPRQPFMLNNCVGHAKLLFGIRSWAVTPHQLYKHLTKEKNSMLKFLDNLIVAPGGRIFGGGGSVSIPPPPPPPPPPKPAPKRIDEGVQQARRDERKRARLKTGIGGTVKTPALGVGEATTTKTLLGN